MSDIDEPPAKVLKIDTIDGVAHVTEMDDYPIPFDGEISSVECGVIEGGADPEPEGQEEWLSEGVLTDDDYNPASQEGIADTTDSHLTSQEEEHLDCTLDSEANEANLAENEADLAENEADLAENEADLAENEAHLAENEAHLAENDAELAENEADLAEQHAHIEEHVANLAENEENFVENEANSMQNEAQSTENDANLMENEADSFETEAHLATNENEMNLSETDANLVESSLMENEENLDSENAVENRDNEMEIDTEISFENGMHTENEANMPTNEANISTNETNISTSEAIVSTTESNLTIDVNKLIEMANIDSNMESQTYTQEYPLKFEASMVKCGSASDIVIQRVVSLNRNSGVQEIEAKTVELNIEETMKNLEGEADVKSDFDKLLMTSTEVKSEVKLKSELKQDEDDGNDTDDLLRMLGEDNSKGKKKLTKTVQNIRAAAARAPDSSDDDDFVYEGSSIKNLKLAQNALTRKPATKAEPEDMDDGDENEVLVEETKTMQRMFGLHPGASILRQTHKRPPANVLKIVDKPKPRVKPRQYQNKRQPQSQSLLKPTAPAQTQKPKTILNSSLQDRTNIKQAVIKTPAPFRPNTSLNTKEQRFESQKIKTEPGKIRTELGKIKTEPTRIKTEPSKVKTEPVKIKTEPVRRTEPGKITYEPAKIKAEAGMIKIEPGRMRVEPEENIGEEEFLDEEDYGLDEDEFAESDNDMSHHRQRIMRPEMMDEEMPSDGESADDGSLYDEMPSSESEDIEDWFQLDIRDERAGDYLPLLGPNAKELLLEEKRRVAARLSTLKQSHTALAASGKQQAALLRRATATLAEVDDMLRAA